MPNSLHLLATVLFMFSVMSSPTTWAEAQTLNFTLVQGQVTSSPAFCIPEDCPVQTAKLSGSFDAIIDGKAIRFPNSQMITDPDIGFTLPLEPQETAGGTTKTIQFSFNGTEIKVNGSIDVRPVDGPYIEYEFTAKTEQQAAFDPQGFYVATPDLRRCAAPLCGGLFIEAVNHIRMQCPDGSRARQCYIAGADWSALGGNPFTQGGPATVTGYLLQGEVVSKNYEGFGDLGLFVASAAYRPVTQNPPQGRFIGLENQGIFCITSPCFSFEEYYLNQKRQRTVSNFDLNTAGASERDQEQAREMLANGGVLIATGRNQYVQELNGIGITFRASQFYLPITFDNRACEPGYEQKEGVCVTANGCESPLLEQMEIGGALSIDPITGEEQPNIQYRCVESCVAPAEVSGPAHCSLALP